MIGQGGVKVNGEKVSSQALRLARGETAQTVQNGHTLKKRKNQFENRQNEN